MHDFIKFFKRKLSHLMVPKWRTVNQDPFQLAKLIFNWFPVLNWFLINILCLNCMECIIFSMENKLKTCATFKSWTYLWIKCLYFSKTSSTSWNKVDKLAANFILRICEKNWLFFKWQIVNEVSFRNIKEPWNQMILNLTHASRCSNMFNRVKSFYLFNFIKHY